MDCERAVEQKGATALCGELNESLGSNCLKGSEGSKGERGPLVPRAEAQDIGGSSAQVLFNAQQLVVPWLPRSQKRSADDAVFVSAVP